MDSIDNQPEELDKGKQEKPMCGMKGCSHEATIRIDIFQIHGKVYLCDYHAGGIAALVAEQEE